ncbi:MAG TPA: glycosyltransferase family 2 protein [Solirubrobacteraceae bacterium]
MSTIASPISQSPAAVAPPPTVAPARLRSVPTAPSLGSVSVVLPCFNEEANVAEAIRNAAAAAAMTSEDYEIIVVDDGSTDGTARIASDFVEADPRVRLILHARNRGYGDALRSGIEAARMDWVLLADADLQFDLRELADFVPLTRDADALWGRRILRQDTITRRASAAAWNRLMRALFHLPVHDVDCGFKLIRRDLLRQFKLQTSGAMISTELVVQCEAEGARFAEIGVHHHPRVAGEETGGNPRVILRAFRELGRMYGALRRLSRAGLVAPHPQPQR